MSYEIDVVVKLVKEIKRERINVSRETWKDTVFKTSARKGARFLFVKEGKRAERKCST